MSMNPIDALTFFAVMLMLAAMPSTSVALVVSRSASAGIVNGLAVTAGIVLGDLVFLILAMLGLSAMAETLGGLFLIVKYLGGAYLIWFGFSLLTRHHPTAAPGSHSLFPANPAGDFLVGFLLTLGDIKAIFFYVGLLPVFMDLSALVFADILLVLMVTGVAVGGVKAGYAFSAAKFAKLSRCSRFEHVAQGTAGSLMIVAGGYLLVGKS